MLLFDAFLVEVSGVWWMRVAFPVGKLWCEHGAKFGLLVLLDVCFGCLLCCLVGFGWILLHLLCGFWFGGGVGWLVCVGGFNSVVGL